MAFCWCISFVFFIVGISRSRREGAVPISKTLYAWSESQAFSWFFGALICVANFLLSYWGCFCYDNVICGFMCPAQVDKENRSGFASPHGDDCPCDAAIFPGGDPCAC